MALLFRLGQTVARVDQARGVVFAYDMASPKRARRVRACLQAEQAATQYSVFETWLSRGDRAGLISELVSECDADADSLAVWAPRLSQKVVLNLRDGHTPRLLVAGVGHSKAATDADPATVWAGCACGVLCYDIKDEDRLRKVRASVVPVAAAVQRSVYAVRMGWEVLSTLLRSIGEVAAPGDQVWVYPLAHAGDLWRVQSMPSSLLPVGTGSGWRRVGREVFVT